MVIDNFDEGERIVSGTTLKVTAQVTNNGGNVYENAIVLELYKNTEDPSSMYFGGPLVTSKSAMTTIQVGETKSVDFIIEGLNPADEYFFFIEYSSAGKQNRLLTGYPFTLTEEKEGEEEPEEPGNTPKPGDANGDGVVNDEDIEAVVHYIMTGDTTNFVIENANVNGDDKVDVADIVLILEMRE